jgi:hypothetical protein
MALMMDQICTEALISRISWRGTEIEGAKHIEAQLHLNYR